MNNEGKLGDDIVLHQFHEYVLSIVWTWNSLLKKAKSNSSFYHQVSESHAKEREFWMPTSELFALGGEDDNKKLLRFEARRLAEKMEACDECMQEQLSTLERLEREFEEATAKYTRSVRSFDKYLNILNEITKQC